MTCGVENWFVWREKRETRQFLWFLLWVACTIYILLGVYWGIAFINGHSMEPTLHDGDLCVTDRFHAGEPYDIDYADIVVFTPPGKDFPLIKRVIGLPGDVIEVSGGWVYRNGERLEEEYLNGTAITAPMEMDGPVTIPEGCFFAMGDNRRHSSDSRIAEIGAVPMNALEARVLRHWRTPFSETEH